MPFRNRPGPRSVTLSSLRNLRGLTAEDLAEKSGTSAGMISRHERSEEPSREKLAEYAAAMDYGPEAAEDVESALTRAVREPEAPRSPVDPTPAQMRLIRQRAIQVGKAAEDLTERSMIQVVRARRARKARRKAGKLWAQFQRCTPEQQRLLVERSRQFQSWAFAERLAHESADAASDDVGRARLLAQFAYRAARHTPGTKPWRERGVGYTLLFVGNALRVWGKVRAGGKVFARALELLQAGAEADPGVFAEWRVLDLEGSLRRDQRQFPEALDRLKRALACAPREMRGRILLNKAFTLEQMGEAERAIEVLDEADPLIDGRREPRLRFALQFNRAVDLAHLGLHGRAEELLDEVKRLAMRLRNQLQTIRVAWLTAKIDAGMGRVEKAEKGFEQVLRELAGRNMAYDVALASLELAVLWLELGRTRAVRGLAEGMVWIFESEDIHREALAALDLFCEAASQERATAEWTRSLLTYLRRAQHDPELHFEG